MYTHALYLLYAGMYVEEIVERWRREGEAFVARAAWV
jgi:hypothetical protein